MPAEMGGWWGTEMGHFPTIGVNKHSQGTDKRDFPFWWLRRPEWRGLHGRAGFSAALKDQFGLTRKSVTGEGRRQKEQEGPRIPAPTLRCLDVR